MLTRHEIEKAQARAADFLHRAAIVITEAEKKKIEVADFGLGDLQRTGLELVVYVNTERVCAKEIIMFPRQACPEHRHPAISHVNPGKEETFRCRWGAVYVNIAGSATPPEKRQSKPPLGREKTYTVFHEIVLRPGDQLTLPPDILHWFQAGDQGAIISEFSTRSTDEADIFTDRQIQRTTQVKE